MPRSARTKKEIDSVKQAILDQALSLINEHGFQGFSMRKLADRIGVQAVTIYNYYENKDHLYLAVLTQGFEELYASCLKAYKSQKSPLERLEAMIRAYLGFGFSKVNFYNLMFTWHVPKYQDYIGTNLEKAAYQELLVALKVVEIFQRAIKDFTDPHVRLSDEEARSYIVYFWSFVHGYIAGRNNSLLEYIYPHPEKLQENLLQLLMTNIRRDLQEKVLELQRVNQ